MSKITELLDNFPEIENGAWESPIQYLKKLRLTKARDLMVQENMKAYIAADQVGYVSSSQFNREFKRYFGRSPGEMVRDLRAA